MTGWIDENGVGHGGPVEPAELNDEWAWSTLIVGYSSDPPDRTDVVWFKDTVTSDETTLVGTPFYW